MMKLERRDKEKTCLKVQNYAHYQIMILSQICRKQLCTIINLVKKKKKLPATADAVKSSMFAKTGQLNMTSVGRVPVPLMTSQRVSFTFKQTLSAVRCGRRRSK